MKKAKYYENTLNDLKREISHQKEVITSLNDMHKQLEGAGYQPLDALEGVIRDLETRRGEAKGAVKRLEELVK